MPTYDYECDACGHQFEAFQSMMDNPLSVCPQCNENMLRRLITGGAGVIFRGSGFYVNDSKKNGSGGKTSDVKEKKTESSSTTSSESTSSSAKDSKSSEKKTA